MSSKAYQSAGVDINEGNRLVSLIKPIVKSTFRPEVLTGIGGFASMMTLPKGMDEPVLVSGTDGVGTKLKLAFMSGTLNTVGIDLVAMCVNDILVCGAEPLFFLDYFATGKLQAEDAASVVSGIAEGCRQAEASLVGGETAEMPDFYPQGEFDLAGFAVGVVDRKNIIDGTTITEGDVVIGLPSSGVHSNGYSLVRRILFDRLRLSTEDTIESLGATVSKLFLAPTTIYVKQIKRLIKQVTVKGMVHITGGGFYENIPRILPHHLAVSIDGDFTVPPLFHWLKDKGEISEKEMFTVFNCGTGFVCIVEEKDAAKTVELTGGFPVGTVIKRTDDPVIFTRSYF